MTRKTDWKARLIAEAIATRARPFHYGVHDCCMFACNLIDAMTGVDIGSRYRGYDGADEMQDVIECNGTIEAMLEESMQWYGCKEINSSDARQGDCALMHTGQGAAMGVVADVHAGTVFLASSDIGFITVPICGARRVWGIG